MAAQLRVYQSAGDDDLDPVYAPAAEPSVRVRLGDLLPLMAMAQKLNFIWLKDFLDDEVSISDDLHDVLMAFRASRGA